MRGKYLNVKQIIRQTCQHLEQQQSVFMTKDALSVGNVNNIHKTELACLPC